MKNFVLALLLLLGIYCPSFAQKNTITGTYTLKDGANTATIAVELNESSNTVKIQGDATWVGDAEAGQVNIGEIAGVFPLNGNTVQYYELLEDEPDEYCKLTFTFGNKSLTVTNDNSQCGGMNVSFNGKYKRTGAAPKTWAAFEEKFSKELAPIGGEFGLFWSAFQKSLSGNKPEAVAKYVEFPLEGIGYAISDENPKVDRTVFVKNFRKIFPAYSLKAFKKHIQPRVNNQFNTNSDLYISETASLPEEFVHLIDPSSPVYQMTASNGDNGLGFSYYFAKIQGKYKLALIQLAG